MADALSKRIYRQLFTENQWNLIYNFIGNALDADEFDSDDVYAIRKKIHLLFDDLVENVTQEEVAQNLN